MTGQGGERFGRIGTVWFLVAWLNLAPAGAALACAIVCPNSLPAPTCCESAGRDGTALLTTLPLTDCYQLQLQPLDKPSQKELPGTEKALTLLFLIPVDSIQRALWVAERVVHHENPLFCSYLSRAPPVALL
ncbi:MAG: hypothetical protein ABDI19_05450 [Armatimonadota bacterium]